jgi:hypothetical protein
VGLAANCKKAMTLSELFGEVKARAIDLSHPKSPEIAIATLIALGSMDGTEAKAVRQALRAIAAASEGSVSVDLDLAAFGPLALAALNCLLEGVVKEHLSLKPSH